MKKQYINKLNYACSIVKRNFLRIVKHLIIVILLMVLTSIIIKGNQEYAELIVSIASSLFAGYIFVIYMKVMPNITRKRKIANLEKHLKKENKRIRNLYEWTGIDGIYDLTIYRWLKVQASGDMMVNLKTIKQRIEMEVGEV